MVLVCIRDLGTPCSVRPNEHHLNCNAGVLNQPAVNRLAVPIRDTEKRRLPKWMEPHRVRLTRFVRLHTEAGAVPITDFKTMRITIERVALEPHERTRWFQEAQIWQDLLLSESDRSRA